MDRPSCVGFRAWESGIFSLNFSVLFSSFFSVGFVFLVFPRKKLHSLNIFIGFILLFVGFLII